MRGVVRRWQIQNARPQGALSAEEIIRTVLKSRGFESEEAQEYFLNPKLQHLADPLRLPQITEAVARVEQALERREQILIYSDYDVDGMTSGALLYRFLKTLGGSVEVFLPDRMTEGYGLTLKGLERALAEIKTKPQLLVALDCGTTSVKEVEFLNEQNIDVVILDHHQQAAELPNARALVNPQLGENQDDQKLATIGLVFKFCHAFLKLRDRPDLFDLRQHLDFVALGTVADLVPLRGDNRILVYHGLQSMGQTGWVGLQELLRRAGVRRPPTPMTCGFILGPRLNASGRLAQGLSGWELLTTEDRYRARAIAEELDTLNRRRQRMEQQAMDEAEMWLEEHFHCAEHRCIVVASRGWHPGVVGIVASRLMRRYHRPAVVIAIDENGVGKGSCRSIEGCSLPEALKGCEAHLIAFGGHEMAAGVELEEEKVDAFRLTLESWLEKNVPEECFEFRLKADFELHSGEIHYDLAAGLNWMAPFGVANSPPLFVVRDVELVSSPQVFAKKHLRFRARMGADGERFDVVAFNFAGRDVPSRRLSLAGYWELDDYTGQPVLRMVDWQG